MARNTIWEDLLIGLKSLAVDAVTAVALGGIYWLLSFIGLLTLNTVLFWLIMVVLAPLTILLYLWLKGILSRVFWGWE